MNRRDLCGAGLLSLIGSFFFGKATEAKETYDPKKSYTYDWQNSVTDDPRFLTHHEDESRSCFPAIGLNGQFRVTVNGKEIENPGSIQIMRTGQFGFVVLVPLGVNLGYELVDSFGRKIPEDENWYPKPGLHRYIKDKNHGKVLASSAVLHGDVVASGWEFPK